MHTSLTFRTNHISLYIGHRKVSGREDGGPGEDEGVAGVRVRHKFARHSEPAGSSALQRLTQHFRSVETSQPHNQPAVI